MLYPDPVLLYLCPLLIIGCLLISFRHWLRAKGGAGLLVYLSLYLLSLFTYAVAKKGIGLELAAPIGGIVAPALYGLLYVCFEVIRGLRAPYGYRSLAYLRTRPSSRWRQILKSSFGSCVGAITGSSLGVLFGMLLFGLSLVIADVNLSWQNQQINQTGLSLVEWSTALFGLSGMLAGGLAGWGCFNYRRLGDRLLIYLTIHGFLVAAVVRRWMGR
jgi:hypothetical protein